MPNDLLCAIWCLDSQYATNVLQNDQTVGYVLPEEPRVFVQDDLVRFAGVFGHHREHDTTVANVRIEDPLETALIADLPIVHRANALSDWHHLGQLEIWELLEESALDSLDFVGEDLDFVGSLLRQILVKEWHFTRLESLLTVPVLKVRVNTSRVNNLVRRGQGQVKEAWDGDGGDAVGQGHSGADVVDALKRVTGEVEVLFGPDDVHLFPVVERLADERDIHETEERDVSASQLLSPAKCALRLPIEGTLPKD